MKNKKLIINNFEMMMFPLGLSMEVDQIQHSFEKQKT